MAVRASSFLLLGVLFQSLVNDCSASTIATSGVGVDCAAIPTGIIWSLPVSTSAMFNTSGNVILSPNDDELFAVGSNGLYNASFSPDFSSSLFPTLSSTGTGVSVTVNSTTLAYIPNGGNNNIYFVNMDSGSVTSMLLNAPAATTALVVNSTSLVGLTENGIAYSFNTVGGGLKTLYTFGSNFYPTYSVGLISDVLYGVDSGSNFWTLTYNMTSDEYMYSGMGNAQSILGGSEPWGPIDIHYSATNGANVFYGVLQYGGSNGGGVLYTGFGPSATALYNFSSTCTSKDCSYTPTSVLYSKFTGALYGTTASPYGGVFAYDLTISEMFFRYKFTSNDDMPYTGLAMSSNHSLLYGVTTGSSSGGAEFYAVRTCSSAPSFGLVTLSISVLFSVLLYLLP